MTQATLPALDCHDGGARLDQAQGQAIAQPKSNTVVNLIVVVNIGTTHYHLNAHIDLPLVVFDASGLWVPAGVYTSVEVDLACGLFIAGN